jgi:hypothetical protein
VKIKKKNTMENTTGVPRVTAIDVRAKLKQTLMYLGIGLFLALVLGRSYPGFTHCMKQQCNVTFTVLNVLIFWGAVVLWPFMVAGVFLGKATCWIVGFV